MGHLPLFPFACWALCVGRRFVWVTVLPSPKRAKCENPRFGRATVTRSLGVSGAFCFFGVVGGDSNSCEFSFRQGVLCALLFLAPSDSGRFWPVGLRNDALTFFDFRGLSLEWSCRRLTFSVLFLDDFAANRE